VKEGGGEHTNETSATVCVFITAVPITKLFDRQRGGRGIVEDMCYERRRAEVFVD
jgi:hypothetical protein